MSKLNVCWATGLAAVLLLTGARTKTFAEEPVTEFTLELGSAKDFSKTADVFLDMPERWGARGKADERVFRSLPPATYAYFMVAGFLFDDEYQNQHPLLVEFHYQDTVTRPAGVWGNTKKDFVAFGRLGGKADGQWKTETITCPAKSLFLVNDGYRFRVVGGDAPLPVARIRAYMNARPSFTAAADGAKATFRFDFGTQDAPVWPGFTPVSKETVYSAPRRYGWLPVARKPGTGAQVPSLLGKEGAIPGLMDRDRGSPDELAEDFCFAQSAYTANLQHTFRADLPNGNYWVWLLSGDEDYPPGGKFDVFANGEKKLSAFGAADRRIFVSATFPVQVTEKRLDLTLSSEKDWHLNALVIYPAAHADEVNAYLAALQRERRRVAEHPKPLAREPAEARKKAIREARDKHLPEKPKPPAAPPTKIEVRDGYLVKDGKPFLLLFMKWWQAPVGDEFYRNLTYYSWANVIDCGVPATTEEEPLDEFFDERDRPQLIRAAKIMDRAYRHGLLVNLYLLRMVAWNLPTDFARRYPELLESLAIDRVGNHCRSEGQGLWPNFNAPALRTKVSRALRLVAEGARSHPALFGYVPWEEYCWRCDGILPDAGPISQQLYRDRLRKKYPTLDALNQRWGTRYRSWDDILPPEDREVSHNFAEFQAFRAESLSDYARVVYDALHAADPDHPVSGEKGGQGYYVSAFQGAQNNWLFTQGVDVSREYPGPGLRYGRASLDFYAHQRPRVIQCDIVLSSDYTQDIIRGERARPYKDFTWKLYENVAASAHPTILKYLFQGARSFYWEGYTAGYGRFIHEAKTLGSSMNDPEINEKVKAMKSPEVAVEKKSLEISRVNQWALRWAGLLLPSKVPPAQVALIFSQASIHLGFTLDPRRLANPRRDLLNLAMLLDHLHVPYDIIAEYDFERISQYKVVIAGSHAAAATEGMVAGLKRFIAQGGAAILYPEGFGYHAETLGPGAACPLGGLDALFGGRADFSKKLDGAKAKLADGTPLPIRRTGFALEATKGGEVLATADGVPVVVAGSNGRALLFGGSLGIAYMYSQPEDKAYRAFFGQWLARAGVTPPVGITSPEPELVWPGVQKGESPSGPYWLLALCNFSDKAQAMTAAVRFLPDGSYDVADITGERPLIRQDEQGSHHLLPDPEGRTSRHLLKDASSAALAQKGLSCELEPLRARMFLIRPANVKVWVNTTADAVRSFRTKPVTLIVGAQASAAEKSAAESLRALLPATTQIVLESQLKWRSERMELQHNKVILDRLDLRCLDTDTHLIVLGTPASIRLLGELARPDSFVYDRVPDKVSPDYPGPGRGLIQLAESVNFPYLDSTNRARDALLILGSDAPGLQAASETALSILR